MILRSLFGWDRSFEVLGPPSKRVMKYSQLAAFVTVLLRSFGEVDPEAGLHLSEDSGGAGSLSAGVATFGLKASRRDVARMRSIC